MLIAKVNSRCQEVIENKKELPKGYIEMKSPIPSADYVADASGNWRLSYTREQATHLRRIAYTEKLDPLICEYVAKSIIGNLNDIQQLKKDIDETRTAIQKDYPFECNDRTTDGNSE